MDESDVLRTSEGVKLESVYNGYERAGVICIVLAGFLSLIAVIGLFMARVLRPKSTASYSQIYSRTHVVGYGLSLLVANMIQSTGTIMSLKWVSDGGVRAGTFCEAQGSIKQAGNIATALWSFMIATHIFNLLFLRYTSTRASFFSTLGVGWALILFLVAIGPLAIAKPERGPFFGVSGNWCWISSGYPTAQVFLEYFLEYLSAGLSFIMYTLTLLRIRGNLIYVAVNSPNGIDSDSISEKSNGKFIKRKYMKNKWQFQWVARKMNWQLAFGRDLLDHAMIKVAGHVIWYPVAYSLVLIPAGAARLYEFSGHQVPLWATILTVTIYNLTGFINVLLLIGTHRLFPIDANSLPHFTTPRRDHRISTAVGVSITPFTMLHSSQSEKSQPTINVTIPRAAHMPPPTRTLPNHLQRASATGSEISFASFDSIKFDQSKSSDSTRGLTLP